MKPITAKPVVTVYDPSIGRFYDRKAGYTQAKPFNLDLPYEHIQVRTVSATCTGTMQPSGYEIVGNPVTLPEIGMDPCSTDPLSHSCLIVADVDTWMNNRLRQKFVEAIGGAANQLAVTWAERKQAIEMVRSRGLQLLKWARSLRKGRFPDDWKPIYGSWRSRARGFGNTWLEYHFGWEPAVHDIYAALHLFEKDPSATQVVVRSGRQFSHTSLQTYPSWQHTLSVSGSLRGRFSVYANPVNWDVILLEKAGVLNPASIAWELVPFSFLVDWFVNVSDVLGSLSDTAGWELKDPCLTHFIDVRSAYQRQNSGIWNTRYPGVETIHKSGFMVRRQLTLLPGPQLYVKPFRGLSPTRGLTAISLLLQTFRG